MIEKVWKFVKSENVYSEYNFLYMFPFCNINSHCPCVKFAKQANHYFWMNWFRNWSEWFISESIWIWIDFLEILTLWLQMIGKALENLHVSMFVILNVNLNALLSSLRLTVCLCVSGSTSWRILSLSLTCRWRIAWMPSFPWSHRPSLIPALHPSTKWAGSVQQLTSWPLWRWPHYGRECACRARRGTRAGKRKRK